MHLGNFTGIQSVYHVVLNQGCMLCRSLPNLPAPPRAPRRQSISSTAATVAEEDAESLAAKPSSSLEQDTWPTSAASVRSAFADPAPGDSTAAFAAPDAGMREEQRIEDGTGPGGNSAGEHAAAEHSAQPEDVSESRVSTATANGSTHGAATSNDVDPFAETDAALHGIPDPRVHTLLAVSSFRCLTLHLGTLRMRWLLNTCITDAQELPMRKKLCVSQTEEGGPANPQHTGSGDAGGKTHGEMPEDLFGGLTLSKADGGESLI